jgi:hypothetical protein
VSPLARAILTPVTADEALDELLAELHQSEQPEPDVIGNVGAGRLENLIRDHGEELWPRIEQLARDDVRVRRALGAVWSYDSPEFDRRQRLLEELGEFWTVTVRFVVEQEDFAEPPLLGWRALEVEPPVPGGQLPRLLRSIAASEEVSDRALPIWVKDRQVSRSYSAWSTARERLDSAHHELATSATLGRAEYLDRANVLREAEQQAWADLADALAGKGQSA